jgi:uncharacterized membrane protein
MERTIFFTTLLAALGSGLIAGAFFVFSVAVMRALGLRPASEGMAAMQAINIVIVNPLFIGVFLGTAVVSAVAAILGVFRWELPRSGYLLAGAILYIAGSLLVTMIFNVPLNNALVAADPSSSSGQELWKNYLTNWTFWNHIRTVASLATLVSFILALGAEARA